MHFALQEEKLFFSGIVKKFDLSDYEIPMVMGLEMAHAPRGHKRSRIAKEQPTDLWTDLLTSVLDLGGG